MMVLNKYDALRTNKDSGHDQRKAHDDGSQGLGISMTVGMILVGRFDRQAQAKVHDARTDHVGERLDSICNQGKRMPNEPGSTFEQDEDEIEPDANQRAFQASLDHLLRGLPSCHTSPLSPIHSAGK
jgi:hypothetical protein